MNILYIGHSYHIVTGSTGFFLELLKKLGDVECVSDDSLDNPKKRRNYLEIVSSGKYDLIVVFQIEYAALQLRNTKNVIFVPMYDGARGLPLSYWLQLRNIRIICFSISLYRTVQMAGCRAIFLQYAPDVQKIARDLNFERAFYWYRRDDLALGGIEHLSNLLGVKHLDVLYRPDFPETARLAPSDFFERLTPSVSIVEWANSRQEQFNNICRSGYYLASRSFEGIGMAFLEAMALGSIVVAKDNPTYSEYIASAYNGLLYDGAGVIEFPLNYRPMEIASMASRSIVTARHLWEANEERLLAWLVDEGSADFDFFSEPPPTTMKHSVTPPLITVVTVVRNCVAGFVTTFESVVRQRGVDFEYIVIDGASTDGTKEAIEQRSRQITRWISEPDSGIYDAMNKAPALAKGEFIIFMNAGDEFINDRALSSLLSSVEEDSDFLVGHHVYIDGSGRRMIHRVNLFDYTFAKLRSGRLDHAWSSGIPGHQATAVRTSLLRDTPYDISVDIAADHDLMFKAAAAGAKFSLVDAYICRYRGGGQSAIHAIRCIKQLLRIALKHTEKPKAVWGFYAPQLLGAVQTELASASTGSARLKIAAREFLWIARAGWHLPPRQILRLGKRSARALLRRLKGARRTFDLRSDRSVSFSSQAGLSWPEPKGVWTDWPTVELTFHERLFGVRRVEIDISQFSPLLAEKSLTVVVSNGRRVKAPVVVGYNKIDFGEPIDLDKLTLLVPVASSPAHAGNGSDERLLGYMIKRLTFY